MKQNRLLTFGLSKERSYFIENLAMMLFSGIDIVVALNSLEKEMHSYRIKKIIKIIKDEIEKGKSLWEALSVTNFFPSHIISLIKIGEKSGTLQKNLKIAIEQIEKENFLNGKIKSAMIYPIFILILFLVVGTGITWFILPRLSRVFLQLKIDLPLPTKILINFGDFINNYGQYAIPVFLLLSVIILYFIFFYQKTKFIGHSVLLKIPIVNTLIKEAELSKFGFILGSLLKADISIIDSISSLVEITNFKIYKTFYKYLKNDLDEGKSFSKSFKNYKKLSKLIPAPIQELIIVAQESGTLSDTLIKIGQNYETKTENTAKNLVILLEPMLLLVIWVGVLGIALAIILPIYSLTSSFGNNI